VDDHLIVVDKPSGLTTMRHAEDVRKFGNRARRFLPSTLQDLLPGLVAAHTGGQPDVFERCIDSTKKPVVW
jgi:hypothetical protein